MRWVSGQYTSLVRQEADVSAVAEPDIVHRAGILKGNSGDLAGKGGNDMEVLCVEKVRPARPIPQASDIWGTSRAEAVAGEALFAAAKRVLERLRGSSVVEAYMNAEAHPSLASAINHHLTTLQRSDLPASRLVL